MLRRSQSGWLVVLLVGCSVPPSDTPSATECVSCHVEDYARADPPHPGVRPDTCGICHTQEHWQPDVLQHEWALTGVHHDTACFDCHQGTPTVFEGTPTDCFACHQDDEASTFPAHHTFGTECASCHTTSAWRPATRHPEPPRDAGPPDAGPEDAAHRDAAHHDAAHHDAAHHDAGHATTTRPPRHPPPSTTPPPPTTHTTPPPPTTHTTPPPDTTTRASPAWR